MLQWGKLKKKSSDCAESKTFWRFQFFFTLTTSSSWNRIPSLPPRAATAMCRTFNCTYGFCTLSNLHYLNAATCCLLHYRPASTSLNSGKNFLTTHFDFLAHTRVETENGEIHYFAFEKFINKPATWMSNVSLSLSRYTNIPHPTSNMTTAHCLLAWFFFVVASITLFFR